MLSLARGLQVLLAFSERKNPSSAAEIARHTALDRAVVRRCIYTLERLDLVRRDGSRFQLDANVLNLGHAYFSSIDLVQRAQPLLDELIRRLEPLLAQASPESREPPQLRRGSVGRDAAALGAAILPLHLNYSPNREALVGY